MKTATELAAEGADLTVKVVDVIRFTPGRHAYTVVSIDENGIAEAQLGGLFRSGPAAELTLVGRP